MASPSHCIPDNGGVLGTNQIPIPNIGDANVHAIIPSGSKRGVVVSMHGLSVGPVAVPPGAPIDTYSIVGNSLEGTFAGTMVTAGWVFLNVLYPEDWSDVIGAQRIFNDIASDPSPLPGARYFQTIGLWWDHVADYVHKKYPGCPIIAYGGSWGGMHTLTVASTRGASLAGFMANIPACILENANPAYSDNLFGAQLSPGLELPVTCLDQWQGPGLINYGTADYAVGWSQTTIASASGGVDVATLTGTQSLTVADASKMVCISGFAPNIRLTGLSGGSGQATVRYTAISGNVLQNCTTLQGSGTTVTGIPVIQNNIDAILTRNSGFVTRMADGGSGTPMYHEFTSTAAASFQTWANANLNPICPRIH